MLAKSHSMSAAVGMVSLLLGRSAPADVAPSPPVARTEIGIFPVVGGDSDVGFGGGEASAVTRLSPDRKPFAWRVESGAFVTFKCGRSPYQDYALKLLLPDVLEGVRLTVRPSYTRDATLKFFGFGNASPPPLSSQGVEAYEYTRAQSSVEVRAAMDGPGKLRVELGLSFTYDTLNIPSETKLAGELEHPGSPTVRGLLGPTRPHGVALLTYSLASDTRDDEIMTHRGAFDTVQLRLSPHWGRGLPYGYQEGTITLRRYVPLAHAVTLAARFVADLLFGDPPFYELANFDENSAIGGGKGVRGVPARRYYGKAKALGNLEVRALLVPFAMAGKTYGLGAALFLDGGRVWADYAPHPELDGTGLGIHYGLGGGLRLQQGSTFVVRGDLAWSPDARPVGVYFNAGEVF